MVNECLAMQMDIKKGLKLGDRLAPFLFLLVAEGIGSLVKKMYEKKCMFRIFFFFFFKGFRLPNSKDMFHISNMRMPLYLLEEHVQRTCVV